MKQDSYLLVSWQQETRRAYIEVAWCDDVVVLRRNLTASMSTTLRTDKLHQTTVDQCSSSPDDDVIISSLRYTMQLFASTSAVILCMCTVAVQSRRVATHQ